MILIQLFASGILLGGVYAVIALGLTLIFGVMRLINFAQGEFIMLGMYGAFWLYTGYHMDPYLSLIVIVPLAFILGIAVERLLFRNAATSPPVMQMLLTFGLSLFLQNIALLLFGGSYRSIPVPYGAKSLSIAGVELGITQLVAFGVSLVLSLALFAYLRWTRLGRALRAVQQSRYATLLMGVNVERLYTIGFAIGIALAAVAGVLLSPIYFIDPTVGANLVFIGFIVVVLGGLGNLMGAAVAGVIIGVVETLSGYFLPGDLKQSIGLVVFLLVLLVRPAGLLGTRGSEEIGFK